MPARKWHATLTVVGLNFRFKRYTIEKLMPGWVPFPVELEREPDNRVDVNAVKVLIAADFKLKKMRGVHLGYLRANIAKLLASGLDDGTIVPVKLWVTEIDSENGEAVLDATFQDVKKPSKRAKTVTGKKKS